MVTTLQPQKVTLYDLKTRFKLKLTNDDNFFPEWRGNLPEITEAEKAQLNRVKDNYLNLAERGMLEDLVKMVVLSPLLDLAGFYSPRIVILCIVCLMSLPCEEGMIYIQY